MPFSLLYPFAAGLFPFAVAGLWYAYRARGDGQKKIVSSVRLLRQLRRPAAARALPKLPPRFFIECLMALAMTALIAGLMLHRPQKRALLIFDSSVSTQQILPGGRTVQDLLRDQAHEFFNDQDFQTIVDGISTDNRVLKKDLDDGSLNQLLETAKNKHADNLQMLGSQVSFASYDQIFVASDRTVGIPEFHGRIQTAVLPEAANNKANIFGSADNFYNTQPTTVLGTLDILDKNQSILKSVPVQIPPVGSALSVGKDTAYSKIAGAYTARFTAKTQSDDQILIDNTIRLTASTAEKPTIYLSGQVAGAPQKIAIMLKSAVVAAPVPEPLQKPETVTIEALDSGEYPQNKSFCNQCSSLLFFDSQAAKGSFSSWNDTSPLLRYVTPSLITSIAAAEIACPEWMTVVLRIAGKPVLCHGTLNGAKKVISGLPTNFDASKNSFLTIATLNMLSWLKESPVAQEDEALRQESLLDRSQVTIVSAGNPQSEKSATSESHEPYLKYLGVLLMALLAADFLYFRVTKRLFAHNGGGA